MIGQLCLGHLEQCPGVLPGIQLWLDDGLDLEDVLATVVTAGGNNTALAGVSDVYRMGHGSCLELGISPAGLLGEARPALGYVCPMSEELFFEPVHVGFEVIVEQPLLSGGQLREDAFVVHPDAAELLVRTVILAGRLTGHFRF